MKYQYNFHSGASGSDTGIRFKLALSLSLSYSFSYSFFTTHAHTETHTHTHKTSQDAENQLHILSNTTQWAMWKNSLHGHTHTQVVAGPLKSVNNLQATVRCCIHLTPCSLHLCKLNTDLWTFYFQDNNMNSLCTQCDWGQVETVTLEDIWT